MNSSWRVGIGYDIHRLVEDRRLVLGGVEIPYERGLIGHSDADVVLHAIGDAMLGAAGLPDIGDLFPDTDPMYKDADSSDLLKKIVAKVYERHFSVNNVDVIVHAEAPKLSTEKVRIAESIANIIGTDAHRVCVKAKTNEGVGPVGHAQAIACTAMVSLTGSD